MTPREEIRYAIDVLEAASEIDCNGHRCRIIPHERLVELLRLLRAASVKLESWREGVQTR